MTDVGEAENHDEMTSLAPLAPTPPVTVASRKRERLSDEVNLVAGENGGNGDNNNVADESSKKTHYQPQTVSVAADMDAGHAQGRN